MHPVESSDSLPHPAVTAKHAATAVAHPVEATKHLAAEAAQGQSARTPFIAFSGVAAVVGATVVAMMIAAVLIYYLV